MYYNNGKEEPYGVNARSAERAWGPWSDVFVVFNPNRDSARCNWIHKSYEYGVCDSLHLLQYVSRDSINGGSYGPYQYPNYYTGDENTSTIYYNISTWNPYTVVLVKSQIRKLHFQEGRYRLIARHSNKALGNTGYPAQGTDNVHQWTYSPTAQGQNWDLIPVGDGSYQVISALSGLALTVQSCGTSNGTNIKQASYDTLDCQHWYIEKVGDYYRLVSKQTGKVLEIASGSTADGGNAQLNTWSSANYQQWSIRPYIANGTYQIIASHTGKALGNSNYPTSGNKNVLQWTANGATGQNWELELLSDGYYKVTSALSDSVLAVQGCSTSSGGNVSQESWSNSNCQKWLIESIGNEFRLTAKNSGLVLMVEDGGGADGQNVEQDSWSNVPWKKWNFVEDVSGSASRVANNSGTSVLEDKSLLQLYPNPLKEKLNLEFIGTAQKVSRLEIQDITGKTVIAKEITVSKGTNKIEINTSSLSHGIYFLKLEGVYNEKILTRRFIVE